MNLKTFLSGVSVAFSIILFRLIDEHVYRMPIIIGAILVGLSAGALVKIIHSIPNLNKEMNKYIFYTLSSIVLLCIVSSYYLFDL